MSRLVVPPRPELRPTIRNFMVSGFDSLELHLPASTDVQIVIYLRGKSFVLSNDGALERAPAAFVAGPSLLPRRSRVEAGSRFIAATFRPSGFFACFGIPVDALNGQLVPLDCIANSRTAAALTEQLDRCVSNQQLVTTFEAFLLREMRPASKSGQLLPVLPLARLLTPASDLARSMNISTRQLERRFLIHHGISLRDYRRVARFNAALGSLMCSPSPGRLAHTALNAHYVDQAHFAKDFRQFVGESPGQFLKTRLDEDSVFKLWQLRPDELETYLD